MLVQMCTLPWPVCECRCKCQCCHSPCFCVGAHVHVGMVSVCVCVCVCFEQMSMLPWSVCVCLCFVQMSMLPWFVCVCVCFVQMCILMMAGFLFAWTPYAIISMVSAFTRLPLALLTVPTMLAKSSPCINSIIYTLANKNFRKAAVGMWRLCSREVTPLRQHSYIVAR